MTYREASALNLPQALHAAGWLASDNKSVADAQGEAAPARDRIIEQVARELRMPLDRLLDLPAERMKHEVRQRLPEHARGWEVDVSRPVLSASIERLKRNPTP